MNPATKILIGVGMLLVIGIGWYALSPLFRNIEVNDALPENVLTGDEAALMESGAEDLTSEEQKQFADMKERMNEEPMEMMGDAEPNNMAAEANQKHSPVMGTIGHPASGFVRVLETSGGPVIRYEEFETINGPELHVYLAKDLKAEEYVDLGPIKGTRGNINYEVPEHIDISEYRYVMYWCVPFGVLFNYAEIQ